ncbi:MAG: hypothetical protein A2V79_02100 [Betaproteobacteria bacterium RBG_16_56_24]|nr:MAG: hypothetical protein A2V79_02100 [Betaproteobacteria bacterium RBG_16_56_24]
MKTRLGIYVFSLLFLPLAGFWISGSEWNEFSAGAPASTVNPPATLLTTLMLAGYVLLVNHMIKLLTGKNLLKVQREYLLWMGAAGAMLVWLLVYLNLFVASWTMQSDNPVMQLLLYTPLFAILAPAVLSTRALLGALPGALKQLSRGIPLPAPGDVTLVAGLGVVAMTGLLGGAAWPAQLFWLLWLAPLLLLTALQLIWQESTIFSGLKNGDWGRVVCAALSGVMVANLAVIAYQANGGILEINLPHPLLAQPGYALFGLLCLQLGDVIAENWRGKQRSEMFRQKKKFPIPVVVKKN